MLTLPEDLRTRLIEALRSGRYKQGAKFMRSAADEYCLLGVVLDICGADWGSCDHEAYAPDLSHRERLINAVGFWPVLERMVDAGFTGAEPFTEQADWLEANTASH